MDASFIMQDLKKYRKAPALLENNPHFFSIYPNLLNDAGTEFFQVDGASKWEKQKRILSLVGKRRGLFGAVLDALKGGLSLK